MITTYTAGSQEAIEAEYGFDIGAPFALVQFYDGEVVQWFPCADMAAARLIVAEDCDETNIVTYL